MLWSPQQAARMRLIGRPESEPSIPHNPSHAIVRPIFLQRLPIVDSETSGELSLPGF